jgi:catalase
MLQGRLFSYGDAHRYRLGVNHGLIPANAPRCPVHSYHRDGAMRVDGNFGARIGYDPNSEGEWPQQPEFQEPPLALDGAAAHWDHRDDTDYYSQPAALFRLMTPGRPPFSSATSTTVPAPTPLTAQALPLPARPSLRAGTSS